MSGGHDVGRRRSGRAYHRAGGCRLACGGTWCAVRRIAWCATSTGTTSSHGPSPTAPRWCWQRDRSRAPAVVVDDTVRALGVFAHRYLAALSAPLVVGITGSSGKTTTKDIIAQLLAELGPTVAPVGSFNTEVGFATHGVARRRRHSISRAGTTVLAGSATLPTWRDRSAAASASCSTSAQRISASSVAVERRGASKGRAGRSASGRRRCGTQRRRRQRDRDARRARRRGS